MLKKAIFISLMVFCAVPAKAEFIITSAILEFTKDGPRQQNIELVSRSKDNDYIVTEVNEIIDPNTPQEKKVPVTDAVSGRLLVTPDKTILSGGNRRTMRFVLLSEPDQQEHIYRVAIKPVVKGVDNDSKVGLKVLLGYEVLVIIRPVQMQPSYSARREGKKFIATNNGNTNILFENGQQCSTAENCKLPPVLRVYPGQTDQVDLPFDMPLIYSVWDGANVTEKRFE